MRFLKEICLTAQQQPNTPTLSELVLFCKKRAGRLLLNIVGPSGVDTAIQPALFGNSIFMWLAGATTSVSIAFGTTWTARNASGAQSHPTRSATSLLTYMARALYSTTATASTSSGIVSTTPVACRGNSAKVGGFFAMFRFAVEGVNTSGAQYLIGLTGANSALTAEPSTLANSVSLAKDSTDTKWQLVFKNVSTITKIDTGETVTAGNVYSLYIFCKPNDSKVTIRLIRENDDTVIIDDVEYSTNLPVNTTFLYANVQVRNTAAAISSLALNRIYVETDY